MTSSFGVLFTVGVDHEYYSGPCRDFDFIPAPETAVYLRSGRLVAKSGNGELTVLAALGEGGEPLASLAGKTLRFWLKLLNPHFANFTPPETSLPLYSNQASARKLGKTSLPRPGETAAPEITALPSPSDLRRQTHLKREQTQLQREGVFGVLEIKVSPTFYTKRAEFRLGFEARREPLCYRIYARKFSAAQAALLAVEDLPADNQPAIRFSKSAPEEMPGDGANAPPAFALRFVSDAKVARSERARGKIQLKRNGEVLIEQLGWPAASQSTAELFVQICRP